MKAPNSRFVGIDVGAETIKLVEILQGPGGPRLGRRQLREHGKQPGPVLLQMLRKWDWTNANGAAVSGRFNSQINLPRVPTKQAQARGYRFHFGSDPGTLVNIGSRGFSVLEMRSEGVTVFRENSRCSQGTGNFLRQLVERFSLTVEEASRLCADIAAPAQLSGRCPVILKTDMTHLANKGEDRLGILAGLFDAVCENVQVLIKPGASPNRVVLAGGVARCPRVRRVMAAALERQGMELLEADPEDLLDLEALGCALLASESGPRVLPPLQELLLPPSPLKLERLPALVEALPKVRRMPARPWTTVNGEFRRLVLGFDIGSTGAKIVALDCATRETIWESYRQTLGDPVGAAQELLQRFTGIHAARCPVAGLGVTGSGREIVGSLLTSCYGKEAVFVVNEIVAHATGALHFDSRVDTIFEIGGQDAKYIRLAEGRIIDCAMNEACSAGTGSFIEEQGRKFAGVRDVGELGQAALAAPSGVSLGQHCSVFMAEVIDEAVAAGTDQSAIISGLYDSIIKNYLNRVKGNRSVGKVIFCQGMPFSANALAAAVARETGSEVVVPPNPGTVGALGIALLAIRELHLGGQSSSLLSSHESCRVAEATAAALGTGPREVCRDGHEQEAYATTIGLDLARFLGAKVEQKDTFVCAARSGCGGAGNRCRIERLRTCVEQKRALFTWGGGCALHDKAARKRKLPDLAPDPFREHEELVRRSVEPFTVRRGKPRIAMSDEFSLKGLFPFFAAFFFEAGFDLEIVAGDAHAALKRGIQCAHVPFCAPMQLFHGVAGQMAETGADWLFVPMLRMLPPAKGQPHAVVCPIIQAAPDILQRQLGRLKNALRDNARNADLDVPTTSDIVFVSSPSIGKPRTTSLPRFLRPQLEFGPGGIESTEFKASCRQLSRELNIDDRTAELSWKAAVRTQGQFDAARVELGRRALEFCRTREIVAVIVLGRSYTIYNRALNSNVPAILREQGAIGIPVDCFPTNVNTPLFRDMYWGYGQTILRAAHQVRRTQGLYALYCSNYSCGPDSFNLHFAAYTMEGKPFAVIETDGHSGDAGTKTRIEAFLHCVEEDRRLQKPPAPSTDFAAIQFSGRTLAEIESHPDAPIAASPLYRSTANPNPHLAAPKLPSEGGSAPRPAVASERRRVPTPHSELRTPHSALHTSILLVPYIGPASEAVAAVFRGLGYQAECLPAPDAEALRRGRRYTSGKECLPMPLSLGSLLQRLEQSRNGERYIYLFPSAHGPCRFGVYNLLNRIVLDRLGWRDRLSIWSPKDTSYFEEVPPGAGVLMLLGMNAADLLRQAMLDVRPLERQPGTVEALYQTSLGKLLDQLERAARGDLTWARTIWQVLTAPLFGLKQLLAQAGAEFAALRRPGGLPVVELTGEIFVRAVEFSNDQLIRQLEQRGLRVHLAPQAEWLAYCDHLQQRNRHAGVADRLSHYLRNRIEHTAFTTIGTHLGWPVPPSIPEVLETGAAYVSPALEGEAALTIGGSLWAWRHKQIDAVINVGPLECMPTKIAEAQFHHLAEREGLLSLSLGFNGDPLNTEVLDNFAYEVHARFACKNARAEMGTNS